MWNLKSSSIFHQGQDFSTLQYYIIKGLWSICY